MIFIVLVVAATLVGVLFLARLSALLMAALGYEAYDIDAPRTAHAMVAAWRRNEYARLLRTPSPPADADDVLRWYDEQSPILAALDFKGSPEIVSTVTAVRRDAHLLASGLDERTPEELVTSIRAAWDGIRALAREELRADDGYVASIQ